MSIFGKSTVWFTILLFTALLAAARHDRGEIPAPAEKKFSGMISEIKEHSCDICKCVELSVILKTEAGKRLEVRLGPKSYFEQHDLLLAWGDLINVTGFRFVERGKEIVLANEVQKGGDKLNLRGKYGKPAWLEAHGHTCPVCAN
jgi:hypothetical protein